MNDNSSAEHHNASNIKFKERHISFHDLIAMGYTSMKLIARALGVSAEYVTKIKRESEKLVPESEILVEDSRVSKADDLYNSGFHSRAETSKLLGYKDDPEGRNANKRSRRLKNRWKKY